MTAPWRTADPAPAEFDPVDPIDALHLLRRVGFDARCLHGAGGDTTVLHYRRTWRGTCDVVLVYSESDAEAYRAGGSLPVDTDPLDLACRPDLLCEAVGTVVEVVAEVTTWPMTGVPSSCLRRPTATGTTRLSTETADKANP